MPNYKLEHSTELQISCTINNQIPDVTSQSPSLLIRYRSDIKELHFNYFPPSFFGQVGGGGRSGLRYLHRAEGSN